MGAQVSALHFNKQIISNTLKACFDALKQNKEEEKFIRTYQELNENERPQIEELSQNIEQIKDNQKTKCQKKAGEILIEMANKTIGESFLKWKKIYQDFKEVPNFKMKGRIIKAYNDKIRMAFNHWKIYMNDHQINSNLMVVVEQQEMQKNLTENVMELKKEIANQNDIKDQSKQKHVNKCFQQFQKRLLQIAIGKWKDKMNQKNSLENGAEFIIKRLRTKILRQAFDLYVKGAKYHKKRQIEEERVRYYTQTRNERLKREVYNQWRIYKKYFSQAKDYWNIIYKKMDKNLQSRGFKRWKDSVKLDIEAELQNKEQNIINHITDLNHEIGEINAVEETQQSQLNQMKGQMTKQAQRVLANTFANYYYVGQTRGFEKWKDFTNQQKMKEKLLKNMIEHWRKYSYYFVKSSFKNWILAANIKQRNDQVQKEEIKINDTDTQLDLQRKLFQDIKGKLDNELNQINQLQNMYNQRLQKSIQMIVKKVDNNNYMSQKRHIIVQWRNYVKREKQFIISIKNVIQKSLWNQGLTQLKQYSFQKSKNENQAKILNKFRAKFWKRVCWNAFSNWKTGQFTTVFETVEETIQETNQKVQEHQEKKQLRKQVNSNKAGRHLGSERLQKLFTQWRGVIFLIKLQSQKKNICQTNITNYQKKQAILKWRNRKNVTFLARKRIVILKERLQQIKLRFIFNAIRSRFQASKEFLKRIANLANIHDHQAFKMGYNAIISFAKSKKYVQNKQKEISTKDVYGILNNLLKRRQVEYFADLKYRTLNKYKQKILKGFTLLHCLSQQVRDVFITWKNLADKKALAIEMHEEGPIREQIFEEKGKLMNLRQLMAEEGYNEQEIEEAMRQGHLKQNGLMLKAVRRMQHYNEVLYSKPLMFDRWRQFVQLRKQFKLQLKFVNNRADYNKSDVAQAFNRWKNYYANQQKALSKLTKSELDKRMGKNLNLLGQKADEIQDKENLVRNLNNQREELVENYIKAQRLALALCSNNMKRSMHKAFNRWTENAISKQNNLGSIQLKLNVDTIAALKDKIRSLEKDNDEMSQENEELRQFSLDGYEIAKNVQALSSEREKLSVDLADKAQTIRKLLDENEKLNKKLKQAQNEAQNLIKSTNNKYMGGSSNKNSGGVPFQSPMARSDVY